MLLLLSYVLVRGVRESAQTNNTMVVIKLFAILLFVFGAAHAVNTGNWHPFMPNGYSGILSGGAIVFFTYIGFDSVSTAAEECGQSAARHAASEFCDAGDLRALYGSVALVLTGIAHWATLNNDAPVANALKMIGMNRLRLIVTAGALLGMMSSLLVFQYGQARIWFAMSRDRLLPDVFARAPALSRRRTSAPGWRASWSAFQPESSTWLVRRLSNIGTLFAFILVSAGVIVLRKKQPERKRGFRVPLVRCCR